MKMRKILAVSIVLCMAVASLSGCSLFGKYNQKKAKAVKAFKEVGYDKEDQDFLDDLAESVEDDEKFDVDGFYVEAEDLKSIKPLFDDIDSFKVKNVKNFLMGGVSILTGEDEDDECSWQYYLLEFVDEDKAEEFFEDYTEEMEEHYDELNEKLGGIIDYLDDSVIEFDDDDERTQFYIYASSEDFDAYMHAGMDLILDGNTIEYIVIGAQDKKVYKKISGDYESFYETLGLETPAENLG